MKRSWAAFLVAALLLAPLTANIGSASGADEKPPIAQPLVREGDFAFELAQGLMGSSIKDEGEAEAKLASVGIAPRNGWIADYPVTPDILAAVRDGVGNAADSGLLVMNRNDAMSVLTGVSTNIGFCVSTAGAEKSSAYIDSTAVESYYDDSGPPVVSYYPPPDDYAYMYGWVDYPFWWSDFWFPGFFVLNDFDFVIFNGDRFHHHGRTHLGGMARVTNHVWNNRTGTTARVDPATGSLRSINSTSTTARGRAGTFSSSAARNSAANIVNRNAARGSTNTFAATNSGTARTQIGTRRDMDRSSFSRSSGAGINSGRNFSSSSPALRGSVGGSSRSFSGGNFHSGLSGGGVSRSGGFSSSGFARSGGFSSGGIARSSGFSGGHSGGFSSGGFAHSGGFSGGHAGGFSGGHGGGFSGGHGGGGGRR